MSVTITARLLGPPVILIDGEPPPAELLWRKHFALCIALWFAPERRRSRDQLIGLLWSDKVDRAARHSLNEALHVIRRSAGSDVIDTSGDAICWTAPPDLDTARFAALEQDDPDGAAALIAGLFCEGLVVSGAQEFEAWLSAERDRWVTRSVDVLARAGGLAEDRGDARRALALAERAVALNGLSDLAARAIVRAHWLNGDRATALAAGEAYRVRLEDDLGVALDERTAGLIARVSRERHPTRPPGAPAADRRSPLIGREAVLGRLLASWRSQSAAAPARLIVISGAGGSGRSRLLDEMVARAVMTGATVARMRAVDSDRDDNEAATLGLARAGLERAPGAAAISPAALATFVRRIPEWQECFRDVTAVALESVHDAFISVVRATAEERPVLLAIDDADRLHPDELRWLAALLREVSGCQVTLLLTTVVGAGSAEVDELTRRAGRDVPGTAERITPLTMDELLLLVEWAVPGWSVEARQRLGRRIWAESAGLPAIAVDVLQAVQHGLAMDDSHAWPAADRTLDATLPAPLPEPLVAAVRLAYRRLGTDAQQLLAAAALLDEPFSAAEVGRVMQMRDRARRDEALDALEWDGWIVADGRGYSFPARAKRRLIGQEMMTPGQRRRLEERIAAGR